MNALAGLMDPRAIGQGVQQAFQEGQQRRAETETRNALGQLVTDPNSADAMQTLAKYNPQAAFAMQDRQRSIQAEKQKAEQQAMQQQLMRAAMGGDESAMKELAVQNFDTWKGLNAEQRTQSKQEAEIFGNAALDILNRPPEQRQAAAQAYAQQLGQQYPEVMQIAQLPPEQLESALRSAVAEAGLIKTLTDMERPDYLIVGRDQDIVNQRDPAALQQFNAERDMAMAQQGQPAQIRDEAGYNALPPGAQYIDPQGNLRTKGGTASNGGGGF